MNRPSVGSHLDSVDEPDSLQIGKAAELRFASLAIAGSGGALELVPPLADDERRDFEIHLKHRFGVPLSIQVKAATSLEFGQHLHLRLSRARKMPVDRAYWFLGGYFDLRLMDFVDPLLLIPSEAFRRRGKGSLQRMPSLSWRSRDRWVRYRVTRAELGRRLVQILERLDARRSGAAAGRGTGRGRRARSGLTQTAEGMAGQLLVAVLAMVGSGGVLKAGVPIVDDEGRDVEIHLGGRFKADFAVQVKVSARLLRRGRLRLLRMTFELPLANQLDDPHYWYLFAYLDLRGQRLSEWVFLVPASLVHAHCRRTIRAGQPVFSFQASMEEGAADQWTPYRLRPEDLGRRLVELMRKAPRGFAESEAFEAVRKQPGVCLLGMPATSAGTADRATATISCSGSTAPPIGSPASTIRTTSADRGGKPRPGRPRAHPMICP